MHAVRGRNTVPHEAVLTHFPVRSSSTAGRGFQLYRREALCCTEKQCNNGKRQRGKPSFEGKATETEHICIVSSAAERKNKKARKDNLTGFTCVLVPKKRLELLLPNGN